MGRTKTLTLFLKGRISPEEVPYLRGSIVKLIGADTDVLLHNHEGDSLRYAYPMVQYKIISGNPAIVFVEDGIESASTLMYQKDFNLRLGTRDARFTMDKVMPELTDIEVDNDHTRYRYKISGWLPLNSENFKSYVEMESISEKASFLERILVINILAMAKGVGIHLEDEIKCTINEILRTYQVKYKDNKLKAFDLVFLSNIKLPDNIGLGKHSSVGFGTIECL